MEELLKELYKLQLKLGNMATYAENQHRFLEIKGEEIGVFKAIQVVKDSRLYKDELAKEE
jgi:hypothetical protein